MMSQHPYPPQSLDLPGFVPNLLSGAQILWIYFSVAMVVGLAAWLLTGKCGNVRGGDRIMLCCMLILGVSHLVVEGYYLLIPDFYQTKSPMILAEIWKLYSMADSRYIARDSGTVAVEVVCVLIDGPACLLSVYGIASQKSFVHPLLLMFSCAEMIMAIIYFVSAWLDGNIYAAGPFYFWFYYVFFTFLYGMVIPLIIAARSWTKIVKAIEGQKIKRA